MLIAVPAETDPGKGRIAATHETVKNSSALARRWWSSQVPASPPAFWMPTLGVAIGAITFTGSVIAFLKLGGRMSGKPIMLPQRHAINIGLAVACSSCSSCSSAAKAISRSGSSCARRA